MKGREALGTVNERNTTRTQMGKSDKGQEALVNTNERNTARVMRSNATRA